MLRRLWAVRAGAEGESLLTKIRIAVRMQDRTRRLYVVDDAGLTLDEMRATTRAELSAPPNVAAAILIEVPRPAPVLVLERA